VDVIVQTAFHKQRVVVTLIDQTTNKLNLELQRVSETMNGGLAEQRGMLAAESVHGRIGVCDLCS
jgi:hypothetical protein